MMIHPADRHIVAWATRSAAPWYYTSEQGLPSPCLKVQCGHVTAYFSRGRLTRIWAQSDRPGFNDMFRELTALFQATATATSRKLKERAAAPVRRSTSEPRP